MAAAVRPDAPAYPGLVRSPGRGVLRWTRAGVLVGLTVSVSLGGHVLGGGAVALSPPMLLGVLALAAMCVAAAESRRGVGEIFAVVLVSQPVLHLLASMGHHHAAAVAPSHDLGVSPGMVVAHVLAAAALSVLLASADRLVWWFAAFARRATVLPLPALLPPRARPPIPPLLGDLPARTALRASPLRRGPPVAAAAT
jgi:hypothetical protein